MKRVGIVTFHHAKHSYGATLQALATIRSINNIGYETELINYENKFEQQEKPPKGISIKTMLYYQISKFARLFIYGGIKDPYRNHKKSDKIYGSISSLYKDIANMNNLKYDILLAGSDQIWNPEITGGIDEVFLLNFGDAKKRISYASSMGSHIFTEEELNLLRKCLSRFDSISVREQYAADIVQGIVDIPVKVVCDPTFLLTGNEWRKEISDNGIKIGEKEKYILTYFVGSNINTYWNEIKDIVEKMNLPVWNIQSHGKMYPHTDKAINNITALELVSYINNAAFIITDSFHGTAFSINLEKQFVSVSNRKNPKRVQNLLNTLGLEQRTCAKANFKQEIDYSMVLIRLNTFRQDSMTWLKESLK